MYHLFHACSIFNYRVFNYLTYCRIFDYNKHNKRAKIRYNVVQIWRKIWKSVQNSKGCYSLVCVVWKTDTDQIHVQVVDMDQSTNDNLVMVAEMTADLN